MKCAVLFTAEGRQIMLQPENSIEEEALKAMRMANKNERARVCMRQGTFDDSLRNDGYMVGRCHGGHFRRFADESSLMIEITETTEEA